jgi:hypothetical protein
MHWNKSFTTYRREASGSNRQYSASATITGGSCFFEPAGGDLKATLGVDQAALAYSLLTPESDVQKSDRVTLDSINYHVEDVEIQDIFGVSLTRVLVLKDN